MNELKTYHETLTANTSVTIDFDVEASAFIVKNLTDNTMKLSFGDTISNTSYIILPTKTCELVSISNTDKAENKTNQVTVISEGEGIVEIRLTDF